MKQGNGWRTGRDPVQRWLRILTAIVCLGVFAFLAVDPERRDWPTLALALGAVLVLLGYEAVVRLPYLGASGNAPVDQGRTPVQPYPEHWPPDTVIQPGDPEDDYDRRHEP